MLNKLWPIFIIISIIFSIFSGNISGINSAIFSSSESAISTVVTLIGSIALWNGLMKILQNTKLLKFICRILNPVVSLLFPGLERGWKK